MICIYGLDEWLSYEELGAVEVLQSLRGEVHTVLRPDKEATEETYRVTSKARIRIQPFNEETFSKISVLFIFGKTSCFDLMRERQIRPEHVVYSSNNTEPDLEEIRALQEGLIDEVFCKRPGYASDFVKKLVTAAGRGVEYRSGYTPFCNPLSMNSGIIYGRRPSVEEFNVLQVLRGSDSCFSGHWKMLCGVTVPWPRTAKFYLLGYDESVQEVTGEPYGGLSLNFSETMPKAFEEQLVLENAHILLQHHPREEAFAFYAAKAALSGVAVVGPPTGAYLEVVEHGETGLLANTPDEAAYFASKLAWEPLLRDKLASRAHASFVADGAGNADLCAKWWRDFV
jgi:glycosyltransferase involved in cell wall biosynthesis